jgi:large subunit ribosomal protein L3
VQRKTAAIDGYESVQIGLVDGAPGEGAQAARGHYKKANVPPTRVRREVKLATDGKEKSDPKVGDQMPGLHVRKRRARRHHRTSRGKGFFRGVVKRHHFAGGAATHGSMSIAHLFESAPRHFPFARREGDACRGPHGAETASRCEI